MKKIIIIGTTGSGKSTLAKKISKKLGYPYIQLDQLFWKKNWGETPDAELFEKIQAEINQDTWVLDGNFTRTQHITWKEADTVIWIDLPLWLTLYQSVTRTLSRAITMRELWPNTGNRESFLRMFSKDSIILWLFRTYKNNRVKYQEKISSPVYTHIKFHHLQSRKQIKKFIKDTLKEH
ncbi:MAG: AAA family ATPase [Bdellovibrionota bacterium]|nr:AAA family ATPase [Bdellovibrionota bacterium]